MHVCESVGKKIYEEIMAFYQKLWNVCCPVWNKIENNLSDVKKFESLFKSKKK